ncbi:MAG: hypothetical protein R3B40_19440 [Polyangiales bacterium]
MDDGRSFFYVGLIRVLAAKRGGILARAMTYLLGQDTDDRSV